MPKENAAFKFVANITEPAARDSGGYLGSQCRANVIRKTTPLRLKKAGLGSRGVHAGYWLAVLLAVCDQLPMSSAVSGWPSSPME